MSPRSNRKTSTRSAKKHVTSMSSKLELAIWSLDTGQRMLCFDRCQLIIAWMSNIKEVHCKPRLYVCQPIREFKQIATAGADTATGSKFPPKWDTAHVRGLHPSVARNLPTWVGMFCRSGYYVGFISLFSPFLTDISAFQEFHWILYPLKLI